MDKVQAAFFFFFFKRNWRHQEMYIILKDIKRLMTKLIQTIESWLAGEFTINLEKAVLNQSFMIQNRETLFVACGSPPSITHLLSRLHRLNYIAASAFQECDSCPWPRLQINTTCSLLLSGLGRISARQEVRMFFICSFWTSLLDFAYKTLGSGVKWGRAREYVVPLGWHNEAGHRRAKGLWQVATHGTGLLGTPSGTEPGGEALAAWLKHSRVSPCTCAGSSHSRRMWE